MTYVKNNIWFHRSVNYITHLRYFLGRKENVWGLNVSMNNTSFSSIVQICHWFCNSKGNLIPNRPRQCRITSYSFLLLCKRAQHITNHSTSYKLGSNSKNFILKRAKRTTYHVNGALSYHQKHTCISRTNPVLDQCKIPQEEQYLDGEEN